MSMGCLALRTKANTHTHMLSQGQVGQLLMADHNGFKSPLYSVLGTQTTGLTALDNSLTSQVRGP